MNGLLFSPSSNSHPSEADSATLGGKNPQRQSNGSLRATRRSQECQVCSLASGMQAHSLLWTTSPPLCQQSCGPKLYMRAEMSSIGGVLRCGSVTSVLVSLRDKTTLVCRHYSIWMTGWKGERIIWDWTINGKKRNEI